MSSHLRYIRYLFFHKVYVGRECFGRSLYLRGLTHDWDKFLPSRWNAYRKFYYSGEPTAQAKENYRFWWRRHTAINDHHWQWWVSVHDDGNVRAHEMSEAARVEMLCDWIGAHKSVGGTDLMSWYKEREATILIAPKTKRWLRSQLENL